MRFKFQVLALILLFAPAFMSTAGISHLPESHNILPRLNLYAEYVFKHNNSYSTNMGYPKWLHITEPQARDLVFAVANNSTDVWSIEDLLAQLQRESHFILKAHSYLGATGASQVMDTLWRGWNKQYREIVPTKNSLYDPYIAVKAQVFVLDTFHRGGRRSLKRTYDKYSGGARNYYADIQSIKQKLLRLN